MSLIRPDAPRKDPVSEARPSAATPLHPATSSTYAPYAPYVPPAHLNGVPPPLTGSPGRPVRIGKMHFHTAGLIHRKTTVTGFLAKPIQFRGLNFPAGTWVQMSSGKPDRIVLNQMATIAGMVCPTRATFRFYPDGFSITSGAVIQKDQMMFDGMAGVQFGKDGQLKSASLAIPFSLPSGVLPTGSNLYYNAQGQLSHVILSQATHLQGVLFLAQIDIPKTDDLLGLPNIVTIRDTLDYEVVDTPVFLHSNGLVSNGVIAEDVKFGDHTKYRGSYLFFDEAGEPQP